MVALDDDPWVACMETCASMCAANVLSWPAGTGCACTVISGVCADCEGTVTGAVGGAKEGDELRDPGQRNQDILPQIVSKERRGH